jgi:hypothetical protein
MKKVFFIIGILLISLNVFAQKRFTGKDLIGYWEPDKHASRMIIWNDVENNLQMVEFSTIGGDVLRLISMKIENESLVVKTVFDKTNWETERTFNFVSKDTLICKINGPIKDSVIYTKVK